MLCEQIIEPELGPSDQILNFNDLEANLQNIMASSDESDTELEDMDPLGKSMAYLYFKNKKYYNYESLNREPYGYKEVESTELTGIRNHWMESPIHGKIEENVELTNRITDKGKGLKSSKCENFEVQLPGFGDVQRKDLDACKYLKFGDIELTDHGGAVGGKELESYEYEKFEVPLPYLGEVEAKGLQSDEYWEFNESYSACDQEPEEYSENSTDNRFYYCHSKHNDYCKLNPFNLFLEELLSHESLFFKNENPLLYNDSFLETISIINKINLGFSYSFISDALKCGTQDHIYLRKLKYMYPIKSDISLHFKGSDIRADEYRYFSYGKRFKVYDHLYLDNGGIVYLYEYLNTTYVGKINLISVLYLFQKENVNYVHMNNSIIKWLSRIDSQNFIYKISKLSIKYLKYFNPNQYDLKIDTIDILMEEFIKMRDDISSFNIFKNKNLTEKQKELINTYYVKLINSISTTNHNITGVQRKIRNFILLNKIYLHKISPGNIMIKRDHMLISCILYMICYSIQISKNIHEKISGNQPFNEEEYKTMSYELNQIVGSIEFMERNTVMYLDLCHLYDVPIIRWPRLYNKESFMNFYNYLTFKAGVIAIFYNIFKLSLASSFFNKEKHEFHTNSKPKYIQMLSQFRKLLGYLTAYKNLLT